MSRPRGSGVTDPEERFWRRVDKTKNCWMWLGCRHPGMGYGKFFTGNRDERDRKIVVYAHRWAWEQVNGPVEAGLQLDHLCRTPSCVRPEHLDPVTCAENLRRSRLARGFSK